MSGHVDREDSFFTRLCLCLFRFLSGIGLSSVSRLLGESRDESSVWRLSESQHEACIDRVLIILSEQGHLFAHDHDRKSHKVTFKLSLSLNMTEKKCVLINVVK